MKGLGILAAMLLQVPAQPAVWHEANASLAVAATDMSKIDKEYQVYTRWVVVPRWVQAKKHGREEGVYIAKYVINSTLSDSELIYDPRIVSAEVKIGKEKVDVTLVRIQLDELADPDDPKDLESLVRAWEEFRFDPMFNKITEAVGEQWKEDYTGKTVDVPKFKGADGEWYTQKWEKKKVRVAENGGAVREVPIDVDKELVAKLIDGTRSQAPVVSLHYFARRSTASIREKKKLFDDLYGGLYYIMRRVPIGDEKKKQTDEDALLAKIKAEKVGGAEQRTAQERSEVTGRGRQVHYKSQNTGRLFGMRVCLFTRDIARGSIGINQSPLDNLLQLNHDGTEAMWELKNGMIGYALFDGKGKLVDAAPSNLVRDTTADEDLHASMSCIRCHRQDDGWRVVKNDVVSQIKAGRLNIFGDLSLIDQRAAVRKITSFYRWEPEEPDGLLKRLRASHVRAVYDSTGVWQREKDLTKTARAAEDALVELYYDATFAQIDARRALAEFGIIVEEEESRAVFAKLVPVSIPEDGRLSRLRSGKLHRWEFDLVRWQIAERIYARN